MNLSAKVMSTFSGDAEECERLIWNGYVPICFSVCDNDVASKDKPDSVYVLCSRLSYLPISSFEIIEYFRSYTIELSSNDSVWFESNGIPLKTTLPAGVLYDLFHNDDTATTVMPWNITIHYQLHPSNKVIKCSTSKAVERQYFHNLKQALFLLHGHTRSFNTLTNDNQQLLWEAVMTVYKDDYDTVINTLRPNEWLQCKVLPIRIVQQMKPTIQKPIKIKNNNSITLNQVMYTFLNDCEVEVTASADVVDYCNRYKVLVQGIVISDGSIPIYELYRHFHHTDLFLYIILHQNDDGHIDGIIASDCNA